MSEFLGVSFGLADGVAGVMLAGLILYALLGGADFGGGIWDLLATGPRKKQQRELIEHSIAPVWEANHVWLILIIVLMFSGFPPAFSALGTALHIPLVALLLGIVLRGTAFTFRQYDPNRAETEALWGRVFAASSLITPFFLGITLGAITQGHIRWPLRPEMTFDEVFVRPWLGAFPIAVGLFTAALFAYIAAVYLTVEAKERELQEDFRKRALASAVVVGVFALVTGLFVHGLGLTTNGEAQLFRERFLGSPWTWPLQLLTAATAIATLVLLWKRRYVAARVTVIAQVTLIIGGWGLAQYPYLIAPDLRIHSVATAPETLRLLLIALVAGSLILVPSLYYLFSTFKRGERPLEGEGPSGH